MITKEAIEAGYAAAQVRDIRDERSHKERFVDGLTAAFAAVPAEREIDEGRFEQWTLADFAGQCRMQARENLDPEYSQFMAALAARLSALTPAPDLASENERLRTALHELDEYLRYNTVLSDDPGIERIFAKAFAKAALERT